MKISEEIVVTHALYKNKQTKLEYKLTLLAKPFRNGDYVLEGPIKKKFCIWFRKIYHRFLKGNSKITHVLRISSNFSIIKKMDL